MIAGYSLRVEWKREGRQGESAAAQNPWGQGSHPAEGSREEGEPKPLGFPAPLLSWNPTCGCSGASSQLAAGGQPRPAPLTPSAPCSGLRLIAWSSPLTSLWV